MTVFSSVLKAPCQHTQQSQHQRKLHRATVQASYQGHQRCLHSIKPECNPASAKLTTSPSWERLHVPTAEVTWRRRLTQLA